MSTNIDLYFEKHIHNGSWLNITNRNIFDGFDLIDPNSSQPLPAFTYPATHTFIKELNHDHLDIRTTSPDTISIQSQAIYSLLSNQVTGKANGLKVYALYFDDLIRGYNAQIDSPSISSTTAITRSFTHELLARITNAYYWQLGLNSDQSLLIPNGHTKINQIPDRWHQFRLVGWIDN